MEGTIYFIIAIALYFLPTMIAKGKNKKNYDAILLTNLLFGWTGVGWLIALVWSVCND